MLGSNILHDSILTRLENMHYEAYVHSCAILWKTVFQELRGLTNTTAILNPMELNDLYDHLWNVGVELQSDDCLNILHEDFRPWPRVRWEEDASKIFYGQLEKGKEADMAELRQYVAKDDLDVYEAILKEVITLFGKAIHISLERTMGYYLKATDGVFRNELRDDWQLQKVAKLLCTNDAAEINAFWSSKGIHENTPNNEFTYPCFVWIEHVQWLPPTCRSTKQTNED